VKKINKIIFLKKNISVKTISFAYLDIHPINTI